MTTEKLQALGIKEVIGEFTTGGFAAASGENIRVVAEKVNGAIVQPGATFGLNEFTGTRGTEQGYVPAAIIQEGALSTAVGGGISQFATTLYNAAYFAGMGDVTHTPHSFYISRYPPGPGGDGVRRRDRAGLLQRLPDRRADRDDLDRRATSPSGSGGPSTSRSSQSPPTGSTTRRRRSSSSPTGTSCSPSGGSSGFTVVNTRIIRDLAGAEIRREDFTTVYNGQQNVVCRRRRRRRRAGRRPGAGCGRHRADPAHRAADRRRPERVT